MKLRILYILVFNLVCLIHVSGNNDNIPDLDSAMHYVNDKNYIEAVVHCSQLIAEGYEMDDLYFIRGFAYYKLSRYEDALADFSRTIKLNENYIQAYIYRGKTRQKLNQFIGAMVDFREANSRDPYKTTAEVLKSFVVSIFSKK